MDPVDDAGLSAQRWVAAAPRTLRWREWDGEVVVRVQHSAVTCLLPAPAAALFAALQRGSCRTPELLECLRAQAQSGAPVADEPTLQTVLAELEALGLARVDEA